MGFLGTNAPTAQSGETSGTFNEGSIDVPQGLADKYVTVIVPGDGEGFFALPPQLFYIPRDQMPEGISEEQFALAVEANQLAKSTGSDERFFPLNDALPVTVEDVPEPGTKNLSASIIQLREPGEDGKVFVGERDGEYTRFEEDGIPQDIKITHVSDSRLHGIAEWQQGDETVQARVYGGDFEEDFETLPGVEPIIQSYRRGEYDYPEDMLAYHAEQDGLGNSLMLIPIIPESLAAVVEYETSTSQQPPEIDLKGVTDAAPAESAYPLGRP